MSPPSDLDRAINDLWFGDRDETKVGREWFRRHPDMVEPVRVFLRGLNIAVRGYVPPLGSDSEMEPTLRLRRRDEDCPCGQPWCVECAEPYVEVYLLPHCYDRISEILEDGPEDRPLPIEIQLTS